MTTTKHLAAAVSAAALLTAGAASAQMFGDTYGTDYDYDTFNTGFGESGYYDALDTDDDALLSEGEYTTGLYADYDRDNDVLISEEEFGLGTDRYYGGAYDGGLFTDYDADADGFLNQEEFGGFYETEYRQNYTGLRHRRRRLPEQRRVLDRPLRLGRHGSGRDPHRRGGGLVRGLVRRRRHRDRGDGGGRGLHRALTGRPPRRG